MSEDSSEPNICNIVLIIDGDECEFSMEPDGYGIVEAAMEAGIEPPHACLEGFCSTCRAKLVEGEVSMCETLGLSDEDRDAGFVLSCQSRPCSKKVVLSYDDV